MTNATELDIEATSGLKRTSVIEEAPKVNPCLVPPNLQTHGFIDSLFVDSKFLKRFGKLSCILKEDGNDNICFVHNHEIIRVTKVFVNTYHLWPKWINSKLICLGRRDLNSFVDVLKFCKLGGGFHSAIEILGKEYHFGGCVKQDSGIFESVPFYSLQKPKETDSPVQRKTFLVVVYKPFFELVF